MQSPKEAWAKVLAFFRMYLWATGQLTISLDIAAQDTYAQGNPQDNADAGAFELLLDGSVAANNALGGIFRLQTIRSTLTYSGPVEAGTHEIATDMRRGWGTDGTVSPTPYQYLDNIELLVTPVPEPSSTLVAALGLIALAIGTRRRREGSGWHRSRPLNRISSHRLCEEVGCELRNPHPASAETDLNKSEPEA